MHHDQASVVAAVNEALARQARERGLFEPRLVAVQHATAWVLELVMPDWTSTLHATTTTETVDIEALIEDIAPWSEEEIAAAVRGLLAYDPRPVERLMSWYVSPMLDEQARRRDAARILGFDAPVRGGIQHVRMDRLVRDHIKASGYSFSPGFCIGLDRDQQGHRDDVDFGDGVARFSTELVDGEPPLPMLLVEMPLEGLPTGATFDGRAMLIPGIHLPDTALTAAEGRLVHELIDMPPALRDRRIEDVDNWITQRGGPVLRILVETDPVPAADAYQD
jgi:hypothetical protein